MRYTKYIAIAALAAALLAGCADDEQLGMVAMPEAVVEAQNTANAMPALTPEQQMMKQNLDAAAQLLVAALNKPTVQRELQQLDYEKMRTDRLSFEQLLRNPAKDSRFRSLATELGRSLNAGAKSGNNLADYLIEQGCELYLPLPLDFYEEGTPITVAGHPLVKKAKDGEGYSIDPVTGNMKSVVVNEDYIITAPIIVLQPQRLIAADLVLDPGDGGGGGGYTPPAPKPTPSDAEIEVKIYEVSIKELHCAMSPNFWEGPIELRMGRVRAEEVVEIEEITIPYKFVKSAYHGWSHANGGWFDLGTPVVWDCRWDKEYVSQAFFAYDHDPESSIKDITVSLKFKDYVSVNAKVESKNEKFTYEGDLIGHKVWDRTWFVKNQYNPQNTHNDWPVLRVGCLQFTIRAREL